MVNFELYILAVALIPNIVSRYTNYNADLMQKILKETLELDIYRFTNLVASDTTNSATDMTRFFPPRAVQVDCEIHQLNSCLKYGFVICKNFRSKDILDENSLVNFTVDLDGPGGGRSVSYLLPN